MKIAMLAPVAWRTPPSKYGPWELVTSLLTEELVKAGLDVTLFATGNSLTTAKLESIIEVGYEENPVANPKVMECLHIAHCMERANEFDIVHNQFDFIPLTYSRLLSKPMVTTIHGFSSPSIIPVYEKYNDHTEYVSISFSNREDSLDYIANIYHGIDLTIFRTGPNPTMDYLLFIGRIHPDKGVHEAIKIAEKSGLNLVIAGIIQDQRYFEEMVQPQLTSNLQFVGSVGGTHKVHLLQNAKAFLHPISFEEPFGLSIVESMACGTPVIAYEKGSMKEIIKDGKTGFIVKDVDSAVEALRKIDSLDRNYCHEFVSENFSKERMAADYLKVYEKILQKK